MLKNVQVKYGVIEDGNRQKGTMRSRGEGIKCNRRKEVEEGRMAMGEGEERTMEGVALRKKKKKIR